jgi:hypothetical protein
MCLLVGSETDTTYTKTFTLRTEENISVLGTYSGPVDTSYAYALSDSVNHPVTYTVTDYTGDISFGQTYYQTCDTLRPASNFADQNWIE